MKDVILIVDDMEINRKILREILIEDYDIIEAGNGLETLEILFDKKIIPSAILLDIIMPGMDGFGVLSAIKSNDLTKKIPVLFITAADADTNESKGLKAGATDFLSKPFNADVVKARLNNHIQLARYQTDLENLVELKTAEVTKTYEQTLEVLATIIEYRNLESGGHVRRTSELTRIMIEAMLDSPKHKSKLQYENCNSMAKAVALHDIGKIGILDSILLKPGPLTDEEFETMKTHTVIGGAIIDSISGTLTDNDDYLKYCKEICLSHHERWDGKGYPYGLEQEDIPLSARFVAIVDVYDALANKRCYKPAYTHEEAVEIIRMEAGKQFDPALIEVFSEISYKFLQIQKMIVD